MSDDEPVAATRDRLGSYDAIETAKAGEPLFPLQGGDPFGAPTVLHWVKLMRAAAFAEPDPKKAERMLRKATAAEQVAWAMLAYQRGEAAKAPEGERARYNEAAPSDDADEGRARKLLIDATGRIQNMVAIGAELIETLARLRVHPESEVKLREAVDAMREVAFEIEPRRGNERS